MPQVGGRDHADGGAVNDELVAFIRARLDGDVYEDTPDEWGEDLLKTLALPYADHPDFRPEWDTRAQRDVIADSGT
jgi:hypothetical protein